MSISIITLSGIKIYHYVILKLHIGKRSSLSTKINILANKIRYDKNASLDIYFY